MPHKDRNRKQRKFILWAILAAIFFSIFSAAYQFLRHWSVSYDIAIINANIHDGTKEGKGYIGGCGIQGNRIVKTWKSRTWFLKPRAKQLIDANGADLSPGFIDTHSHADLSIGNSGKGKIRADNFVGQGITTVIVGNCGNSHVDIPKFVRSFDDRKININIATLIGLNSIRKKVMFESSAPANASEIASMCEMIRGGMKAGALGASTGLAYPPGIFASRAEIIAQLKVAKEYGGIHTTHMRSEGERIKSAVEEVIDLSYSANIPLLISHYKIMGLNNCIQFDSIKKLILQARSKDMTVYVDYYPYTASSTNLSIFLPDWYLAMDRKNKSKYLNSPAGWSTLKAGVKEILQKEGFNDFKFATVAYYPPHRHWQGKTLEEIDRLQRNTTVSSPDAQIDIFLEMENHGGAQMIYHNICPNVMKRIPIEEESMIGTDSAIRYENTESIPHPRGWGAFPRFIKQFVREENLLSLDEAIYRMTGLPSHVFKLENRGRIQEGYYADLVIFDFNTIQDAASYNNPFAPPRGIKYVIVNGSVVVDNSKSSTKPDNNSGINIRDVYPGVFINRKCD
ncbi:MAG: amidohydrolase family protein [Desulfotomaculaceae bacterium]|nr:amidohydrolase family protein [Desulfotomaculaceae bacterium]